MQTNDADVFFSSTLLRLDEASSAVQTDNEATSDFGIECTTMSCFLDAYSQSAMSPGKAPETKSVP